MGINSYPNRLVRVPCDERADRQTGGCAVAYRARAVDARWGLCRCSALAVDNPESVAVGTAAGPIRNDATPGVIPKFPLLSGLQIANCISLLGLLPALRISDSHRRVRRRAPELRPWERCQQRLERALKQR